MKTNGILTGLLVLMLAASPCGAASSETAQPQEWAGGFEAQEIQLVKKPAKGIRALTVLYWVAAFADARSTDLALTRPGNYEANPILGSNPSDAALYAITGAECFAVSYGARQVKPKVARWALVVGILIHATLAVRNSEVGQ